MPARLQTNNRARENRVTQSPLETDVSRGLLAFYATW